MFWSALTSPVNGEVICSLTSSIVRRTSLCLRSWTFATTASSSASRLGPLSAISARVVADASRVSSIANRPKLTTTKALAMIAT